MLWMIPGIIFGSACAQPVRTKAANAHPAPSAGAEALPYVRTGEYSRPAGRLEDGVLTLRLVARHGQWYPEGPEGLGLPVAAFAEEGKPLQNPGPLVRVPVGTEVRASVRNSLDKPLTLFGLGAKRGIAGDSIRIEPDSVREVRFRATEIGTFYYAGKTNPVSVFGRRLEDSQLNGAIVVDPPNTIVPPNDRVFVISWWFTLDSASTSGLGRATLAINGQSWPHAAPLRVAQSDSLHWRWINLTGLDHPMHLHGFYFRVDGAGDGAQYTTYVQDQQRTAVTEVLPPGATRALAWSPDRPGNWIFHCHFVGHISHHVSLNTESGVPASPKGHAHDGSAASHEMAGLVLGVHVTPRGPMARRWRDARPIRLLVRSKPNVYGIHPGYSYALDGSSEAWDTSSTPLLSPTLVLEKDQPVAITVINRSHEPAAVHWHGIELESFPDGVPGWSGAGKSLLPAIAPGDSLVVRFTPPRAGTFMYHSHFNEFQQIASGLYGPIIVTEPGKRHDPETDRVLLFSDGGPTTNLIRGPFPPALLNGSAKPEPMELRVGVTYRLRLINIRTDFTVAVALLNGSEPAQWRPVAKDGADLPAAQATSRPARLTFAPGEIHDVEFTPRAAGELTLQFGEPRQRPTEQKMTNVLVRVR